MLYYCCGSCTYAKQGGHIARLGTSAETVNNWHVSVNLEDGDLLERRPSLDSCKLCKRETLVLEWYAADEECKTGRFRTSGDVKVGEA